MSDFGLNIKYLRKKRGLTQSDFAKKIGVSRAVIGSYEEGRAFPKLPLLKKIADYFSVMLDDLVNVNFSDNTYEEASGSIDLSGKNIRVVTAVVDGENEEFITVVPDKASAGYTHGYADPDYVGELPAFSLPLLELSRERTYRVFQIRGDSMEPIKSGAYIICEYLLNWDDMNEGMPHILLTKEDGIVFKRVYKEAGGKVVLKSDNMEYPTYFISMENIQEIWKAVGYISFQFPEKEVMSNDKLHSMLLGLQKEVKQLKEK